MYASCDLLFIIIIPLPFMQLLLAVREAFLCWDVTRFFFSS